MLDLRKIFVSFVNLRVLRVEVLGVVCVMTTLCGCVSMPKADFSALKPAGPASSVIAVWEPAVSNGGEKPVRGFGGRVYFYDQDMTKPVKVHGTVVVYAFDEDGRAPTDTKPNEGFVFDDKTLNSSGVYKKSKLGHSYNLWVPWDSEGPDGKAKKISLIVRYIPKKGSSVVSSQATAYLPGKHDQQAMVAQSNWNVNTEEGTIQQVSLRTAERPVPPLPERNRLTEERMIEANESRPQTMQAITIR